MINHLSHDLPDSTFHYNDILLLLDHANNNISNMQLPNKSLGSKSPLMMDVVLGMMCVWNEAIVRWGCCAGNIAAAGVKGLAFLSLKMIPVPQFVLSLAMLLTGKMGKIKVLAATGSMWSLCLLTSRMKTICLPIFVKTMKLRPRDAKMES